ncbi:MAG TPA: thiol-disulfide oxidoreductase DCC family protein [Chryseolinea sp.]|nr:thiol-disulfide oxidoreductase DCC family protein [Chryseolinea sp.]
MEPNKTLLILFDGVCNLCNGFVKFLIKRDPAGKFRFASLQSDFGRSQLIRFNLNPDLLHSVIVIEADNVLQRSDAALRIVNQLGGPWKILNALKIFPRFLRDALYNVVARNRYKVFGKRDSCMIPTPELKARFIES